MELASSLSRLGTETAFDTLARATRLAQEGRSIINLGIGQPDFATPAHIVEAAVKALRDGHHGYTPANGILPLREAVSANLKLYRNVDIDPEQVVIVPGGKVTMAIAIMMFGEPGAEILYPDPGFPIYQSMIAYSGAKPVPVHLYEDKGYSFSAEEVLSQINERTRLLIVNSPGNPTGGVVPKEELDRLVEGLAHHPHVAIMSDEIYARMVFDGEQHASLTAYPDISDRLILLDGWSKTYAMTGWRLGYGVWPKSIVDKAKRLAINLYSCVNAPTQFAGIAALEGPQDEAEEMVVSFDRRRKLIFEEISQTPTISAPMPKGAFYAFTNIKQTGLTSREFQDRLLDEMGVAAISGTSFGSNGEGYLRFSYAASDEMIQEAFERIRRFLAE